MSSIKELSEAVLFVTSLASAVADAAEDGRFTLVDGLHLMPVLNKLPSAIDGLGDISVAELSQEDVEKLVEQVKAELDLPSDTIESCIEDSFDIALKIYALVKKIRG
jgi:hypothetical protein